jgi:Na+:H+ antiporter, NhaA family
MAMPNPFDCTPLARAVSGTPPEAWKPLARFTQLIRQSVARFLHIEVASGIILLIATAVALIWANSHWADSYLKLWRTPLGIHIGALHFERPLTWFVNDGLMVIFFFVVGMERSATSSTMASSQDGGARPFL